MSKKKNNNYVSNDKINDVIENDEFNEMNGTVEKHDDPVIGIVSNCEKLNIRKEPNKNSKVLRIVGVGTELTIDENGSNVEFAHVYCKDGLEGYCMNKYICIN